jgi:hypothetical protein
MKKSELRQLIKEEISKVLKENELFANFKEDSNNELSDRFARTMSETLHLLNYFYGDKEIYEDISIDDLFSEEGMDDVKDGDDTYAGPKESLKYFQSLPNTFIISNNIGGEKESFKITKSGSNTFNVKPI